MRSLILILKRAGSKLWAGEGPEYPQVVFDGLKDNPAFIDLLHEDSSTTPDRPPWSLTWFSEFLDSVRDTPVYQEVFAKLAEFMCEELQHERFGDSRPAFAMYIAKVWSDHISCFPLANSRHSISFGHLVLPASV